MKIARLARLCCLELAQLRTHTHTSAVMESSLLYCYIHTCHIPAAAEHTGALLCATGGQKAKPVGVSGVRTSAEPSFRILGL